MRMIDTDFSIVPNLSLQGKGESEVPQGTQQAFCFILKSNFFFKKSEVNMAKCQNVFTNT